MVEQLVRKCVKCNRTKSVSSFYIHTKSKGNLRGECIECTRMNRREYTKEFPFRRKLDVINQRCYNTNNKSYKYYGGKGIQCFLSIEDLKTMWSRDRGYLLNYPSVDRVDSKGDYALDNCEWIEQYDNVAKGKRKLKDSYKRKMKL